MYFQRLGVHFDVYSGESFHQDQAQEVVQQLRSRGLLKTSEYVTGCVLAFSLSLMSKHTVQATRFTLKLPLETQKLDTQLPSYVFVSIK